MQLFLDYLKPEERPGELELARQLERLSEVRMEKFSAWPLKHQLMSSCTALVAEGSERSVDPSAPARTDQIELAAAPSEDRTTAPRGGRRKELVGLSDRNLGAILEPCLR